MDPGLKGKNALVTGGSERARHIVDSAEGALCYHRTKRILQCY